MARYHSSDDFTGAEFVDVNLTGAVFREADLSRVRMHGVLLTGANLDGDITGLVVNGVEVEPLIEAELDRRFPERLQLRPTTAAGFRQAWTVVEGFWADTMRRVEAMPEQQRHRSVGGEWSFTETVRHLVFVTDAWLGQAVLRLATPFHPLGLPASFLTDSVSFGIDPSAAFSYEDVVAARADRMALVRDYVAAITQDELDLVRDPYDAPGWPPPAPRTARACLQVILNEEWTHHQFALRDLAALNPT
jgi:hypothetical protein